MQFQKLLFKLYRCLTIFYCKNWIFPDDYVPGFQVNLFVNMFFYIFFKFFLIIKKLKNNEQCHFLIFYTQHEPVTIYCLYVFLYRKCTGRKEKTLLLHWLLWLNRSEFFKTSKKNFGLNVKNNNTQMQEKSIGQLRESQFISLN